MATADTYPARKCKLCRWFNPDLALLETEAESLGLCEWPADNLPWSLRYGNRERLAVGPLEGSDCPTFEPRDVAAVRAAVGTA